MSEIKRNRYSDDDDQVFFFFFFFFCKKDKKKKKKKKKKEENKNKKKNRKTDIYMALLARQRYAILGNSCGPKPLNIHVISFIHGSNFCTSF